MQFGQLKRREVITLLGGTAAGWPLIANGESSTAPLIGYLDASGLPRWFEAFQRGLAELGYMERRTVAVEFRSGAGRAERLPDLAAELVRLHPRLIVAS